MVWGQAEPAPAAAPAAPGPTGRAWEIRGGISVDETYTDNLRLAPPGAERSDWVTSVTPTISINGTGPRLRLSATYSPQFVYRVNEETHDTYQQLNASGNVEFVRQLFFLDARANITQQNISLQGSQSDSNINNTLNRTTLRDWLVSPFLRHNFGTQAQGEIRYTFSSVSTNDRGTVASGLSTTDSDSNRLDMRLSSGPAFRLVTWSLAYNKERIEYDLGQKIDIDRITATARRLVVPTLGVRVEAGYEDNNYISTGPALDGAFWNIGPEWTPSPRTRLLATAGRRFDDPYYSFDFSHRARLTSWGLSYSDDITTQRQQVLIPTGFDTTTFIDTLFISQIPDPVARQQAVRAFIAQTGLPSTLLVPLNFFTTTPFTQKQWRGTFGIHGVRNTILANLFWVTRDAAAVDSTAGAGAGDFALSNNTKQKGASLAWALRMSSFTTTSASLSFSRNETPGISRVDDLTTIRIALSHQFQPRVSGSLNIRRLKNDSNFSGLSYTENAVSAAVALRF